MLRVSIQLPLSLPLDEDLIRHPGMHFGCKERLKDSFGSRSTEAAVEDAHLSEQQQTNNNNNKQQQQQQQNQPDTDEQLGIASLKSLVDTLRGIGTKYKRIAKVLKEYQLSDVVCLQNTEITRAFLKNKQSTEHKNSKKNQCDHIDDQCRLSVDRVMSSLDVQHTEIVLKYGSKWKKETRKRYFFNKLISVAVEHKNLEMLKLFVKQIIKWNILDEQSSKSIVRKVFVEANKEVLDIFLDCQLDIHMEKLYNIKVMQALFSNPAMPIGFFKNERKFNVNEYDRYGRAPLFYALKNRSFAKIKYLLDLGADPDCNEEESRRPWLWILTSLHLNELFESDEPKRNSSDDENCAELWLQHGARLFGLGVHWAMFDCCMVWDFSYRQTFFVSIEHLSKLILAYNCIYEAAGLETRSFRFTAIKGADCAQVSEEDNMFNFYKKCKQDLEILKNHEIRENITMFTIVSETGRQLMCKLNQGDCKVIASFIDKHSEEKTLNRYYLSAMREHLRQFRMLIAQKNKAMRTISDNIPILMPYYVVLQKIVSNFTYQDLLTFQ